MADEQNALTNAIIANPAEITPRLVLADWLDEHEEPARAEFFRAAAEVTRLGLVSLSLSASAGEGEIWHKCLGCGCIWIQSHDPRKDPTRTETWRILSAHCSPCCDNPQKFDSEEPSEEEVSALIREWKAARAIQKLAEERIYGTEEEQAAAARLREMFH
jgi:uncharacterized protein (TIGR02996 family)